MEHTKSGRIDSLDAIRGIAAFMVVYGHYSSVSYRLYYPGIFSDSLFDFTRGGLGVYYFFILSGFVIFMSLKKVKSPKEFLIKRFIRLYPTFWVCLILTTAFSFFQANVHLRVNSLLQFFANFTMFPILLPESYGVKFIDGSYWSLCPELFFYFFMAIWLYIGKLNYIKIIGSIWVLLSCLIFYLGFESMKIGVVSFNFSMLFFSGVIFYIMWNDNKERRSKINYIILIINYALACEFLMGDWIDKLALLMIFIVFYLQSIGKLPKAPSFLLFLGKISYPWYLLHQSIGYLILYWMYALFGAYSQIWIVVPMFLTGCMAYLVVEKFEKRMLPYLNRVLLRKTKT